MYVSKKQFYIITVLFLLVPFSVHWRLFVFGQKTTAVVLRHIAPHSSFAYNSESTSKYAVIGFQADNEYIEFKGPEDLKYPIGKKITVVYNSKKPSQFVMLNFAGIVLSNKMIIPGVLLLAWFAFYITIRQMKYKPQKKSREQIRFGTFNKPLH
jgi:hypothetical protein